MGPFGGDVPPHSAVVVARGTGARGEASDPIGVFGVDRQVAFVRFAFPLGQIERLREENRFCA